MKRNYDTGVAESITYFVGTEIEHTPAFCMKTLFVVGVQNVQEILELAGEHYCEHIYFGANQSFKTNGLDDYQSWEPWEKMIRACLDAGFWCTLDFDVSETEGILESPLVEHRRFIPQISVKLPYIQQLGYNATIKLDDKDFSATNPGVWCHSLHKLMNRENFTNWDQYGKDEIIK